MKCVCFYLLIGVKKEWPELVGVAQAVAKAQIEKENQFVTAVPIPKDAFVTLDWCCNRVWLGVDDDGLVVGVPKVG